MGLALGAATDRITGRAPDPFPDPRGVGSGSRLRPRITSLPVPIRVRPEEPLAHEFVFVLRDLRKVVPPDRVILDGVTLAFLPGAKIGVLGPNGAGKSSLLRIMAGVDREFLGEAQPAEGLRVGFLPQEPELDPAKTVGGQAVLEGVMMRAAGAWSVAVRKPEGHIVARRHVLGRLADRNRAARIPFVRGIVVLWESLSLGFRALSWSAEMAAGDEEEPLTKSQIGWTMALAFALFAGIFIILPALAAGAVAGEWPVRCGTRVPSAAGVMQSNTRFQAVSICASPNSDSHLPRSFTRRSGVQFGRSFTAVAIASYSCRMASAMAARYVSWSG